MAALQGRGIKLSHKNLRPKRFYDCDNVICNYSLTFMAIPTTSITGLLNTGKTPHEKFEVLKQNGYLTRYALENPQKFLDLLLIAEEDAFRQRSRIPEGGNYEYDPNSVSGRLIGEGFIINYGICHLCGVKHEVGRLCYGFYEDKKSPCRRCGGKLKPGALYCGRCGERTSDQVP